MGFLVWVWILVGFGEGEKPFEKRKETHVEIKRLRVKLAK